jgi:hypothetical protein
VEFRYQSRLSGGERSLGQMTLYLATRHYFGSYALNVLEIESHVIAEQLGHRVGVRLFVELCGQPDKASARRRIRDAFDSAGDVRRLRIVGNEPRDPDTNPSRGIVWDEPA